tara:strand:+ start:8112 stop:8855 length:744 start_codon:yes stop_codon:yes gene_type:complete
MKKILFFVLFLAISIFILSEFVGDKIIKGILEKNISSSIDRKTEINDLKISYLKGEAVIKKISVNNKNFPNQLLTVENAFIKLKSSSIFSNIVEISSVELDGIEFNYYFNLKKAKINDNVKSLNKSIDSNDNESSSSKQFNIEKLNIKNIALSVNSPDLKISQTVSLKNMEFNNVGNTQKSKSYKTIIKDFSKDAAETVKKKFLKSNVKEKIDKLKDINEEKVKDKIKKGLEKNKDKLKDKLKKLIN